MFLSNFYVCTNFLFKISCLWSCLRDVFFLKFFFFSFPFLSWSRFTVYPSVLGYIGTWFFYLFISFLFWFLTCYRSFNVTFNCWFIYQFLVNSSFTLAYQFCSLSITEITLVIYIFMIPIFLSFSLSPVINLYTRFTSC